MQFTQRGGNGGEFGLDCEEYVHTGLQTDWAHCLLHKHLCAACQPSSLCNSSKSWSYVWAITLLKTLDRQDPINRNQLQKCTNAPASYFVVLIFQLPPTNPPQLDILQNRESDSSLWPTHASPSIHSYNLVLPKVLSEARSPHHFQRQVGCGRPTTAVSVRVLPELLNLFG